MNTPITTFCMYAILFGLVAIAMPDRGFSRKQTLAKDRFEFVLTGEASLQNQQLKLIDKQSNQTRNVWRQLESVGSATVLEFGSVKWNPSGLVAYIEFLCSGTASCLMVISGQTLSQIKIVTNVENYFVLAGGSYNNHLAVRLRKQKVIGIWNWYWLFDPEGNEVGLIGDRTDLDTFTTSTGADQPPNHL